MSSSPITPAAAQHGRRARADHLLELPVRDLRQAWFEPRLPLRFQCIGDTGLLHPVPQHRNTQWPLLLTRCRGGLGFERYGLISSVVGTRLREVYPPDRTGLARRRVPWISTASEARTGEVNATCLSIPAVWRQHYAPSPAAQWAFSPKARPCDTAPHWAKGRERSSAVRER